jgi:hypothetical protein
MTFDEMETSLRPPAPRGPPAGRPSRAHPRPGLPDFARADAIGTFWGHPETRTFGELLIDLEEEPAARAVVFGLLAEMDAALWSRCTDA